MTTPSPADLPIRRLSPYDLAACLDLAEDRGWSREEHKWRLLLTAGQGYGIDAPDRPHGLIGAFVLTRYDSADGAGSVGGGGGAYACVSMVLVAERWARRGLGRRLMEHAVAESADATPFLSATSTGRPLYESLGFKPVGTTTMLTGAFTPPPGPPRPPLPPGVTVRTATAADLPAVLALDAEVFGADRTELLARLPSFADRFTVAEDGDGLGGLTGFAAAWPNGPTTVLGPVVAQDLPTAQALIRDLGTYAPGPVRFDVDARHGELERWLRDHGLDGDFRCTLMVHSAPDLPGDIDRRFAPYSVALG